MSEIREDLVGVLRDVRDGKIPLDTAKQIHLTTWGIVMDTYAGVAEEKLRGSAAMLQEAKDAMQKV